MGKARSGGPSRFPGPERPLPALQAVHGTLQGSVGGASALRISIGQRVGAANIGRSSMQFVATIAVVASVLVFAYQARELARQSRMGNEVAGTQAYREILRDSTRFADAFIQYPELHAYYYDRTPTSPSATDSVRLAVIAERHADILDVTLVTVRQLKSLEYTGVIYEWDDYVTRVVGSSSLLRSTIRDFGDWPTLDPFVARYDESQTAPPKGAS